MVKYKQVEVIIAIVIKKRCMNGRSFFSDAISLRRFTEGIVLIVDE